MGEVINCRKGICGLSIRGKKKTPMGAQGLQGIEEYPTLEILETLLDKAQNKPVYI